MDITDGEKQKESEKENSVQSRAKDTFLEEPQPDELQPEAQLNYILPVPNRVRFRDAIWALGGFFVLWVSVSLALIAFRDYFTTAGMAFLGGFLTQASVALVLVILITWKRLDLQALGFRRVTPASLILSAVAAYAVVISLDMAYSIYVYFRGIREPVDDAYEFIFSQRDAWSVTMTVVLAMVLAPILEETLFRGVVYASLRTKWSPWLAAGVSSAIFSAIHLQLIGFLPRFFLGLALAFLYERYKSLYPCMALHALNNGVAVLFTLAVKLPS